jgi:hypothetical protein
MRFIMVDMSSNCLSSLLTSWTVVPEPEAMPLLAAGLDDVGRLALLRRHGADDDRGLTVQRLLVDALVAGLASSLSAPGACR